MGLGDLAGMLKGLQQAQRQMEQMKESLEAMEVEGRSGGGMVVVRANGRGEILSVKIERQVVDPDNVEFLEDLIVAALRQATEKSQQLMQQELTKAAAGLGIPGLGGLLGKT